MAICKFFFFFEVLIK